MFGLRQCFDKTVYEQTPHKKLNILIKNMFCLKKKT